MITRRKLLTSAAALAAYSQIKNADALTAGQRVTILGGARTFFPSLVAIGDSITAADEDAANQLHANSYITFAQLAMGAAGQSFNILRNSGVGGNTTAQMVARFATDVSAYSPKVVAILAGTNDTDPEAQTRPNLTSMINSTRALGALPVLATIPPAGTAAISAPTATAAGAITGGTLAAGTYSYRVSAINGLGETTAATAVTGTVASGTTGAVTLSWGAVEGATGYKIYGRTAGSELLIATTGATVLSGQNRATCGYVDTGSVTPSGALPGSNTTSQTVSQAVLDKISGVNTVVNQLAAQYGCPVVDFYSLLVDIPTGKYQTGYTKDGTHPTPKTSRLMGQLWATTVKRYLQVHYPYLAVQNNDATCLFNNAWFSNNNGSVPTGWSASGGSGACESVITVGGISGSVFQINRLDFTSRNYSGPSGNISGVAAGDRIALSGLMKVTNADTGGGQVDIKVLTAGNAQFLLYVLNSNTPNSDWCPFYFEGVVPASTTAVYFKADVAFGPITAQFARLTLRNLTTLGAGGAF